MCNYCITCAIVGICSWYDSDYILTYSVTTDILQLWVTTCVHCELYDCYYLILCMLHCNCNCLKCQPQKIAIFSTSCYLRVCMSYSAALLLLCVDVDGCLCRAAGPICSGERELQRRIQVVDHGHVAARSRLPSFSSWSLPVKTATCQCHACLILAARFCCYLICQSVSHQVLKEWTRSTFSGD